MGTFHSAGCASRTLHTALQTLHSTQNTALCTLCRVRGSCTLHSAHSAHCVHTVHCTLHIAHSALSNHGAAVLDQPWGGCFGPKYGCFCRRKKCKTKHKKSARLNKRALQGDKKKSSAKLHKKKKGCKMCYINCVGPLGIICSFSIHHEDKTCFKKNSQNLCFGLFLI